MTPILFALAILYANTIQQITGFAGMVLAMPPAIFLLGPDNAKTILTTIGSISCLWIAICNFKYLDKKEFFKIVIFMGIGMLIGIEIYDFLPTFIMLKVYGGVICLIALKYLFFKSKRQLNEIFLYIILLLSGVIHGVFVSGGALVVIYALQVFKDKDTFRATLAAVWVVLNSLLAVNQYQAGLFTQENLHYVAIALIPVVLAVIFGEFLHRKINAGLFLKITYVLLFISGFSLFW